MREIKIRGMMANPGAGNLRHEGDWAWLNVTGHDDRWVSKSGAYQGEILAETIGLSTGLKDKNKVEIYKGDIVKWKSTHRGASGDEHIDVMEWDDEAACFMLMPWVHEPYAADMEVIGNKYENPELLES